MALYSYLFFPPLQTNGGHQWTAPYGLRKTEAQLLKEGFIVGTISPNHLGNCLKDVRVLGIHVMDPFGLGLVSTTLALSSRKNRTLQNIFKSWSHCSLAAVASAPKLFAKLSEPILQKQSWWDAEVGIETGSPEVAKKIMPAKAHSFKAEDWHDVVVNGMGLMHDNKLVPACTLIVGLPDEREEDVIQTMDLVANLKEMRSLIVPLFFVPLGKLKSQKWFTETKLSNLHKQLLIQCAEHGFRWVDNLLDWSFSGKWHSRIMKDFYKGFSAIAKQKVRQIE